MDHETPCTELRLTKQKVENLEDRANKQEKTNTELYTIIQDIRDRLLGRPSWWVVMVITSLSGLCVGLIVRMLT